MAMLETLTRALFGSKEKAGAAAAQKGADKRSLKRVPQRMRSGFVWTDKLITPRPCMIKDLSLKGARVEILGDPVKPSLLSDGVKLYFDSEKHEVPCTVAWTKGRMAGLKFEGRPRSPSRTYK